MSYLQVSQQHVRDMLSLTNKTIQTHTHTQQRVHAAVRNVKQPWEQNSSDGGREVPCDENAPQLHAYIVSVFELITKGNLRLVISSVQNYLVLNLFSFCSFIRLWKSQEMGLNTSSDRSLTFCLLVSLVTTKLTSSDLNMLFPKVSAVNGGEDKVRFYWS